MLPNYSCSIALTDSLCSRTEMPEDLELKYVDNEQFLSKQTSTLDQLHLRSQRLMEQKKKIYSDGRICDVCCFQLLQPPFLYQQKRWKDEMGVRVSQQGASHTRSLPHFHGTTEMPLGRLPSDLIFCGFKRAGTLLKLEIYRRYH